MDHGAWRFACTASLQGGEKLLSFCYFFAISSRSFKKRPTRSEGDKKLGASQPNAS